MFWDNSDPAYDTSEEAMYIKDVEEEVCVLILGEIFERNWKRSSSVLISLAFLHTSWEKGTACGA